MAKTEDRLIEAAIRSFVRYGVRKTTMSDIATEAQVSRPTLYASYRSKDEILAAAIHQASDKSLAAAKARWAEIDDLGEKLDAYFETSVVAAYELIRKSPDADDIISGFNAAGRVATREARLRKRDALAEILVPHAEQLKARGQSPTQLAHFVVTASMSFKYEAASKKELLELLASLRAAVLATVDARPNQTRRRPGRRSSPPSRPAALTQR